MPISHHELRALYAAQVGRPLDNSEKAAIRPLKVCQRCGLVKFNYLMIDHQGGVECKRCWDLHGAGDARAVAEMKFQRLAVSMAKIKPTKLAVAWED